MNRGDFWKVLVEQSSEQVCFIFSRDFLKFIWWVTIQISYPHASAFLMFCIFTVFHAIGVYIWIMSYLDNHFVS